MRRLLRSVFVSVIDIDNLRSITFSFRSNCKNKEDAVNHKYRSNDNAVSIEASADSLVVFHDQRKNERGNLKLYTSTLPCEMGSERLQLWGDQSSILFSSVFFLYCFASTCFDF